MSHYCKICGRYRPNEKFSGKGHAAHICKECAKIPLDKRNEMETINHINTISPWMSKKERAWLQKMTKDKRENVRLAAESAWKSLSARHVTSIQDATTRSCAFARRSRTRNRATCHAAPYALQTQACGTTNSRRMGSDH